MPKLSTRYGIYCALLVCLILVTGCTASLMDGSSSDKEYTLTKASYAAADMLIQQSRMAVTTDTPLEVGVLKDLNNPNEITNFGNVVAGQIGSRFVQLGYNVTAASSIGPQGGQMGDPMAQGVYNTGMGTVSQAMIAGQYAVARNDVMVNLRIIETSTGRVLAAYDYSVPYTRDVKELTKTRAERESFFDF